MAGIAQGAEESYLTVMLATFIAQIDLVLNSKQETCLNKACYLVTRLVKFYPQDKRPTMVARRATLSESEAFRNEVRGDTPTVTAVCGFRHADGVSPDT